MQCLPGQPQLPEIPTLNQSINYSINLNIDKIFVFKKMAQPGRVAHTLNPSTLETEAGRSLSKLEASLVYRVSSRIGSKAKATKQRNPVLEKQKRRGRLSSLQV